MEDRAREPRAEGVAEASFLGGEDEGCLVEGVSRTRRRN